MRIAILSDVHSNYIALKAVMDDAQKRGVDDYWFLGDAVDYGWQPVETLETLRSKVKPENWVMGNHDALFAGLLPERDFRHEARIMINHNRALLEKRRGESREFSDFMTERFSKKYQPTKQQIVDGTAYFISHSGFDWVNYDYYWFEVPRIKEYILFYQIAQQDLSFKRWKLMESGRFMPRVLFYGHSHLPVVAYIDLSLNRMISLKVRSGLVNLNGDCKNAKVIVINPGSVGFPHDRLPFPSYVMLDTRKRQVEFCRVKEYDPIKAMDGYEVVKSNIDQYLYDGMGRIEAQDYVGRLEQEILQAPYPKPDMLSQDWRSFYWSDKLIDIERRK